MKHSSVPSPSIAQLRESLSATQKTILSRIALTFVEKGKGIPMRLLHHEFGASFTRQHLSPLTGMVFETQDYEVGNRYEPTAIGLFVCDLGEHYEQLLVRYLEFLEFLFLNRPLQNAVTWEEVQNHFRLSDRDRTLLGPLIRATSLYDSSTGYSPDGKWTAGVLKASEHLPEWPRKIDFLHQWLLQRYNPNMPVYAVDREKFMFGSPELQTANKRKNRRSTRTPERDFFVSYNKADTEIAFRVQGWLEGAGYSTFMQAADFHSGSNFVLKMDEGMKTTHRTLALLSHNYLGSQFTAVEWADAFSRDPKGEHGVLVPVKIDDTDVTGILGITSHIRIENFIVAGDWESAKGVFLEKIRALPVIDKASKRHRASIQPKDVPLTPAGPQDGGQVAVGSNILQAGRDIHQHYHQGRPKTKSSVPLSPDVISPQQRQQVRRYIELLVEGTVGVSRGAAFAKWWSKLQADFGINEYKELPARRFSDVEAWYRQQAAINVRKWKTKAPEDFRKARYGAIHQALEKLGVEKLSYYAEIAERLRMRKAFASLTELTKKDLDRVYTMVLRDVKERNQPGV